MLDERLKTAALLVRKGSPSVDVGTDHAYLAAYLYTEGITEKIIASDVNKKPLEIAKKTLSKLSLENKIELIQSDGLKNIKSEQAFDIIICGMGGELIDSIILNCPYSKDKERNFILQPMTKIKELRKSLYKNGFEIVKEIPVIDKRHTYSVMQVCYTEVCDDISELFSIVGKIPENDTKEAFLYLKKQRDKQEKIIKGLSKSSFNNDEKDLHIKLLKEIDLLLEEKFNGYC